MKEFWENKNVLVTGGAGFIGSNLVANLKKLKSNVVSIDSRIVKGVIKANVTDFKTLKELFSKYNIDTVFHLAAQPLVEVGEESPYETYKTNLMGILNVLEVSRINKVRRVVIASTTHVYGDNPDVPYKEEYFPRPSRPYETSKSCADLIAQSYANSYGLSVFIARFVNTYGEGDLNFRRVVPYVIKNVLENKSIEIYGGRSVRDYIYIKDVVSAYLLLGSKDNCKDKNKIFNFGSGNPINVVELAKTIIKISGKKNLTIKVTEDKRKDEVDTQYVSFEKAKKYLGWEPKYSLEEGLKKVYVWYTKI